MISFKSLDSSIFPYMIEKIKELCISQEDYYGFKLSTKLDIKT